MARSLHTHRSHYEAASECAALDAHLPTIVDETVAIDDRGNFKSLNFEDADFFMTGVRFGLWLGLECKLQRAQQNYVWADGTQFAYSRIADCSFIL